MERVRLSLDEIAKAGEAERCLACDAPASATSEPVLGPGVDLGALDEHLPAWTVCAASTSETRPHRWARFEQVSMGMATVRGRWIAMDPGDVLSRASCDDAAFRD